MTSAATAPGLPFDRARHLLFSCVGLLHGPLAMRVGELLALVVQAYPQTAQFDALGRLVALCFVAFIAWLAFEIFDTRSGVTVFPRRWADVGALGLGAFAVSELVTVWSLWQAPPEIIEAIAARWAVYVGPLDHLLIGWLVLALLAAATAEELVYRALLLRAFEGYMQPWLALALHAVVFEGVHVFVYDRPFQAGIWFVDALILGYVFQRTRSLAVPVLMHVAHNLTLISLAWYLAR